MKFYSSVFVHLNINAAQRPARKFAPIVKSAMHGQQTVPLIIAETATAGLNAPIQILPTANAPTITVEPIAKP